MRARLSCGVLPVTMMKRGKNDVEIVVDSGAGLESVIQQAAELRGQRTSSEVQFWSSLGVVEIFDDGRRKAVEAQGSSSYTPYLWHAHEIMMGDAPCELSRPYPFMP